MIEGTGLDPETFLPHLTIAITRERHDAAELRDVLIPLRNAHVATETATEVKRVRVPASRTTFLQPWEVLEVVAL
jgi:2'-5' RNA ligase